MKSDDWKIFKREQRSGVSQAAIGEKPDAPPPAQKPQTSGQSSGTKPNVAIQNPTNSDSGRSK